ncbi:PAS domain S-box protein [Methanocalculus taiwanensis]|uniref:histidine kinase n=1 Tax=Methanocalculus taiwanensis TaxID=106207 RepID=A0ABD4TM49_9EURY|nr:PAS domain S-box protein [Methanocalculus taiwanensis]MCQ1538844.1 PAS domain S-box protein [Methanocalculus taiwanensis]
MTSHTLLYIDDEPDLLRIGRLFLERNKGLAVSTCESALDAINILSNQPFDAIISDYQMPGMNGIQFLKHLRQNGDETPFIIFTGKSREDVVIEAFNNGADFYMQKGGDPRSQFAELQNKIQYAIERKKAEKALRESEERYRNVVQAQTEFICRFKPDGTHLFVNEAYSTFFGMQEAEIIGTQFKPRIHPDDRDNVTRLFASLSLQNPSAFSEQRVIMPDGRIVWQRWNTRAIFDEKGKLKEYQSVGRDITEVMDRETELQQKNMELQASYEQLAATEEEIRQQLDEIVSTQTALRESEQRYQAVIEYQTEFICRFKPDGTHILVNDAYARYFRKDKHEIMGRVFSPNIHPDDQDLVSRFFSSLTYQNPEGTIEHRIIMPDGEVRWQQWNDRALFDEYGHVREYQSVGRDITEKKLAEEALKEQNVELNAAYEQLAATEEEIRQQLDEIITTQTALRESEQRYQAVIEYQTEFICRFRPDGTHILVNDAYARYFGRDRHEIMGKTFSPNIHPEDKEMVSRFFASLTYQNPEGTIEHRIVMPDGEIRWQQWNDRALFDEYGHVREYQSVGRDITVRKQAEEALKEQNLELNAAYEQLAATEEEIRQQLDEIITTQQALRESEQRYQAVIEYQTEFICRFRPDGTHILVNDAYAKYFGKTKQQLLGENFSPKIHPDDYERVRNFFASLIEEHPIGTIEHRIIMPDGEVRWQQWNDRAIFDEYGHVREYQSVGRDITEKKRMEEALRLTNNKLHLLSSITRHDILNKIMIAQGYLDLTTEVNASPALAKYLDNVTNAVSAIEGQIIFTREYEQLGVSEPVWTPIKQTIERNYDQDIQISYDGPEARILADPMIQKVFSNLIDNTLRHGEGADQIRIRCRETESGLAITYEDNGSGIPEKEKERIFYRGFGKNTGYGLFLVREILTITNITITENGEPGKGARFEIHVPKGGYCIDGASGQRIQ